MQTVSRRTLLHTAGGVLLGLAAYSSRPNWPGFFGGYLEATPLEPRIDDDEHDQLPPAEFVTPHDDDPLASLEPLQEALRRPSDRIELSRREFGTAFDALEELPVFEPYRHDGYDHSVVARGIYVEDAEYTYRVRLLPQCSEVWWIESLGSPDGRNACHRY
ncbi:hypothetical protein [Natronobacterium texcoconense]|uniref:Uncharacterized protein n=1 Tax=Natronobacterium texcoconense TaxID=1095778 RepID=A0A1H1C8H9_NATTX|nr:hypothetical protein [Natronobacterium texcoconense]SDQ60409.1 hypothetical protein SAMN04489842_1309 [Natronobacterium texcoconense]